jgi:hypothetical protein
MQMTAVGFDTVYSTDSTSIAGWVRRQRCRHSPPLQEVDGIQTHVFAIVVISHDSIRVFVTRHHLDLTIAQSLIERPRYCSAPQVVRESFPTPE